MIEKSPSVLSPFYEDAGNAAFSLQCTIQEERKYVANLVMTLTNQETKEVFNGYLLTPNVVAQRLGYSTFIIKMLTLYYSSGKVGKLPKGKYDVTLSIKVNRNGTDVNVPIKMKEPSRLKYCLSQTMEIFCLLLLIIMRMVNMLITAPSNLIR